MGVTVTTDDGTHDKDMKQRFLPHVDEIKQAFEDGGKDACRLLLERKRDEWKDIPLYVAVIGNSGVGKSSFINAIRDLEADDEGAAKVGVKETTVDTRSYSHPQNPMLVFWDLPGVGTDRFPRETYLSDIGIDRFDFFLLITANRFTENDTWLGKEIRERNKKYYFIRTKIDSDVEAHKKAHRKRHNKEAVVKEIRQNTKAILIKNGCEDVPVFLIDNYEPMTFDFEQLKQSLVEDFPELKRTALIMSLQATSKAMIQLKVAELRSRMWKVAMLSAAVAAVPVPGLSFVFDSALVVDVAVWYYSQLGLDEASLKRYATLTSIEYMALESVVKDQLGMTVVGVSGIRAVVLTLAAGAAIGVSEATEEISRWIFPLIGTFIIAPIASYAGTLYMLEMVLDKMEKTANAVMDFAAGQSVQADNNQSP